MLCVSGGWGRPRTVLFRIVRMSWCATMLLVLKGREVGIILLDTERMLCYALCLECGMPPASTADFIAALMPALPLHVRTPSISHVYPCRSPPLRR